MKKSFLYISFFVFSFGSLQSQTWSDLDSGIGAINNGGLVKSIINYNNVLYVGGGFDTVGNTISASCIAKWNGLQWDTLGQGVSLGGVNSVCEYNGEIYVGGSFNYAGNNVPNTKRIAKWDGASWQSVYTSISVSGQVYAMQVYNGELYVGGDFFMINGMPVNRMAKYNGTTWSDVGGGIQGGLPKVFAMTVYNNKLIVGGLLYQAGTIPANYIASWDGTQWDSLGAGTDYVVEAMTVDTSNNLLYVGGGFTSAGGVPTQCIAKWNGNTWSGVGGNFDCNVLALGMYHGELFAGGCFNTVAGISITGLAKWNGLYWDTVVAFPNNTVQAICEWNDSLYVGGYFSKIGNDSTLNHIARFYADPDTTLSVNEIKKNDLQFVIHPNPADKFSEINYFLPADISEATISVYDINGKKLKEVSVTNRSTSIQISVAELPNGIYFYSLENSGAILDSKKLVIIHQE